MCQFPPLHCTAYQVIPLLHFKVMSELVQDFMWEGFLQILSPQSLLSWETMMQPALDWLHGILCGGEWNGDKNADLQTGRFARLSVCCRHDTIIRLFSPQPNKTHPCLSAMAQFWRRGYTCQDLSGLVENNSAMHISAISLSCNCLHCLGPGCCPTLHQARNLPTLTSYCSGAKF